MTVPRAGSHCPVCMQEIGTVDTPLVLDGEVQWFKLCRSCLDTDGALDALVTAAKTSDHCDFCNKPELAWVYPCRTFDYPPINGYAVGRTHGAWVTCQACRPLVDRGKWRTLALSNADVARADSTRKQLVVWMLSVYAEFERNRLTKEPVPLENL